MKEEHASLKQLKQYPDSTLFTIKAINFQGGIKVFDKVLLSEYEKNFLGYIKHANAHGYNIYILPDQLTYRGYTDFLLDDLKAEQIKQIRQDNLYPLYVLQTSPDNFQVILRFVDEYKMPDHITYLRVNRYLVKKYNADTGSIGKEHFFRLAGFTNRKEKYRDKNGLYPYVRIDTTKGYGMVNEKAKLDEIITQLPPEPETKLDLKEVLNADFFKEAGSDKDYLDCEAYVKTVYTTNPDISDLSKLDFRAASYALLKQFTAKSIYYAILNNSPNLSERHKNINDYLSRTIQRAMQVVEQKAASKQQIREGDYD